MKSAKWNMNKPKTHDDMTKKNQEEKSFEAFIQRSSYSIEVSKKPAYTHDFR